MEFIEGKRLEVGLEELDFEEESVEEADRCRFREFLKNRFVYVEKSEVGEGAEEESSTSFSIKMISSFVEEEGVSDKVAGRGRGSESGVG